MKKIVGIILVLAMGLAFMGCGAKGKDAGSGEGGGDTKAPAATEDAGGNGGGGAASDAGFKLGDNGDMYVFNISSKYVLRQDAWLGVVPSGEYTKEVDADEVDIYYVYPVNYEEGSKNDNVFEYPKEDVKNLIEDGNYTMVLCDTDEDTGKVVLYFPITVKGDSLKADLDKITVNK